MLARSDRFARTWERDHPLLQSPGGDSVSRLIVRGYCNVCQHRPPSSREPRHCANAGAWALCSPRGACAYGEPGVGRTARRFCVSIRATVGPSRGSARFWLNRWLPGESTRSVGSHDITGAWRRRFERGILLGELEHIRDGCWRRRSRPHRPAVRRGLDSDRRHREVSGAPEPRGADTGVVRHRAVHRDPPIHPGPVVPGPWSRARCTCRHHRRRHAGSGSTCQSRPKHAMPPRTPLRRSSTRYRQTLSLRSCS